MWGNKIQNDLFVNFWSKRMKTTEIEVNKEPIQNVEILISYTSTPAILKEKKRRAQRNLFFSKDVSNCKASSNSVV